MRWESYPIQVSPSGPPEPLASINIPSSNSSSGDLRGWQTRIPTIEKLEAANLTCAGFCGDMGGRIWGEYRRGTKSPNRSRWARGGRPVHDERGKGDGTHRTHDNDERQIDPVCCKECAALKVFPLNSQSQQYDGFTPDRRVFGRTPKCPL